MSVVFALTYGMLVAAALCVLARLVRGRPTLDRTVALEVVVVLVVVGIAVEMAQSRSAENLTLLVAVALLAFIGSVAALRLAEGRERHR